MASLPRKPARLTRIMRPKRCILTAGNTTQRAWQALFLHVTLILCFLHAFLKIWDRTTKAFGAIGQAVHKRVWDA